MDITPKYYQ